MDAEAAPKKGRGINALGEHRHGVADDADSSTASDGTPSETSEAERDPRHQQLSQDSRRTEGAAAAAAPAAAAPQHLERDALMQASDATPAPATARMKRTAVDNPNPPKSGVRTSPRKSAGVVTTSSTGRSGAPPGDSDEPPSKRARVEPVPVMQRASSIHAHTRGGESRAKGGKP